jgi:hypothetical protein
MSWTVACFCNEVFSATKPRCPRCGRALPDHTVRPNPAGDALGRLID